MRYIAFFMVFLISEEALGEGYCISGHVRDKNLSQPLAGAVIQLFSSSGKILYSATITTAAGDFVIALPSTGRKFELRATFAGYVHYSRKLKRSELPRDFQIEMEEDLRTYPARVSKATPKAPEGPAQAEIPANEEDQHDLRSAGKYATKPPKDQAAAIVKVMKAKLELNAAQQIVVAVIQERYLMSLSSVRASGVDQKISLQELKKHQKERNQKLEAVLTEQQYEKWMRYLEKHDEG